MRMFIERLLFLIGYRRGPGRRYFELDTELHDALQRVAQQERRPVEVVESDLLTRALAQRHTYGELWDRWQTLSPRAKEVTALTCLGYTNPQIAARLCISTETVRTHIRQALNKYNLHAKAALRIVLADWDFSAWD